MKNLCQYFQVFKQNHRLISENRMLKSEIDFHKAAADQLNQLIDDKENEFARYQNEMLATIDERDLEINRLKFVIKNQSNDILKLKKQQDIEKAYNQKNRKDPPRFRDKRKKGQHP